jgi:hypothetical protein
VVAWEKKKNNDESYQEKHEGKKKKKLTSGNTKKKKGDSWKVFPATLHYPSNHFLFHNCGFDIDKMVFF